MRLNLSDFEPEMAIVDEQNLVKIAKVGGGTLGNSYVGSWAYTITDLDGHLINYGADYVTNVPTCHADAAHEIAEASRTMLADLDQWQQESRVDSEP